MKQFNKYDEKIAELVKDNPLKYYEMHCKGMRVNDIAKEVGVNHAAVSRSLSRLEKRAVDFGFLDAYSPDTGAGLGRVINKVTTHVKDGGVVQEWIRTNPEADAVIEYIKEAVEAIAERIKGTSEIIAPPEYTDESLMSLYGFYDRHIGMMAWSEETSDDNYNLKLSRNLESKVIKRLVASQPASKKAIAVFGSDFFHAENDDQVTPGHGNKLEVDGRASKVFKSGVLIAINAIYEMLKKHETVRVEVVPGNHDPVSSDHLMVALWAYFDNNPRVYVVETHGPFAYCKFGVTLLAFHHGEKAKYNDMYTIITTDRRKEWASINYADVYTGHFHTESVKNIGIVRFESMPTPIPKDAYASSRWRSRRSAHAITYNLEDGMIGRSVHNITPKSLDSSNI